MLLAEAAFNWRPGALEWLLVLEGVILLTMAVFRSVAGMLGRGAPTDPFVIFYRVFWSAMRSPKRYPVPVNYEPVPPKERKVRVTDEPTDGTGGLTDDELERLMGEGMCDDLSPVAAAATAAMDHARWDAPVDMGDDEPVDAIHFRGDADDFDAAPPPAAPASGGGGTLQSNLVLHVVAGPVPRVVAYDGDALTLATGLAPDDGRSNAVALRLLGEVAGIETHQIALLAGHARAEKTTRVSGLTAGQLRMKLFQATVNAPPQFDDPAEPSLGFRDDD